MVIALGGALGALPRYSLGLWISSKWNQGFPLGTFIINITGAFLLGFLNILLIEKLTIRIAIGVIGLNLMHLEITNLMGLPTHSGGCIQMLSLRGQAPFLRM